MVAENGTIVHIAPVTWYEHGYFNFNPKLITAVAAANKYALVAEAFWFPVNIQSLVKRQHNSFAGLCRDVIIKVNETIRGPFTNQKQSNKKQHKSLSQATIFLTYDGQNDTPNRDKVSQWFTELLIPANCLYLVAYRKIRQTQFIFPYDVQS
jgi:hypothetical protein